MTMSIIRNNQYNIGNICSTLQVELGRENDLAIRVLNPENSRDYTFREVDTSSNKFANVLTSLGFAKGDIFFTFLGRSYEQTIALLGSLKLRLITGTLFVNFGEEALLDRLNDSRAKGIITSKKHLKKLTNIKAQLPALKCIIITDIVENIDETVLSLNKLMNSANPSFTTPLTPDDTPSILHYTSGSTGKPKGVLHQHRSVLLQNYTAEHVLSLKRDEMYWCTADPGWVTGVSYGIIGPMSLGVPQIYFDGGYNATRWASILQDEKVSIWYTAPTALRMLMQEKDETFNDKNFESLKYVFSVGEPLNPEVAIWAKRIFGKDVHDTYFQTETGSIIITNHPGLPIKLASMGKPIDPIEAHIVDDNGNILPPGQSGHICLKAGWDSMFIACLNNKAVYDGKFKKGFYYTGDKGSKDNDGYFWFGGRSDDIINTAGHLVGPFEVESALLEIDEIIDAAVIAAPDPLLFEKVVAFVRLKEGVQFDSALELKIQVYISRKVASIAVPKEIIERDRIPKNKSGKIMRRYLRALYEGKDPGDISTLDE
jgi:acetyl-CoA synthetase